MATAADDPSPMPALTPAQQRASLWADPAQQAYAVIAGAKVTGLRERLATADVDDWDGLWTGELDADERAAAPLLVTLKRESAFTDWLLGEATAGFGGWGAIAQSRLPFLRMRTLGRALCKAVLPNGQSIRIDWMDPEVIEALLPVAPPDQLQHLFADIETLVTLSPTHWTRWSAAAGRLVRRTSRVA